MLIKSNKALEKAIYQYLNKILVYRTPSFLDCVKRIMCIL
jgi:hypothetical protein